MVCGLRVSDCIIPRIPVSYLVGCALFALLICVISKSVAMDGTEPIAIEDIWCKCTDSLTLSLTVAVSLLIISTKYLCIVYCVLAIVHVYSLSSNGL